MRKLLFSLVLGVIFLPLIFGFNNVQSHQPLEVPSTLSDEIITSHLAYRTCYKSEWNIPIWVAYELTKNELDGPFKRSNKFKPDPDVPGGTCNTKDYTKSGFDRGHMAPAADMTWDEQAMMECFYMSNICPQAPELNRGIWKTLEESIREWAQNGHSLFIVMGPIVETKPHDYIGLEHKVLVPDAFYKAVVDTVGTGKAIGFYFRNTKYSDALSNHAMSIDEIEKLIHRDLFFQIPRKKQDIIEKSINLASWGL